MIRKIARTYTWTNKEVAEALIAQLRAKDIPTPQYVGNAGTTKWTPMADGSMTVEWTDEDTADVLQ
jgi:hypothetical protein